MKNTAEKLVELVNEMAPLLQRKDVNEVNEVAITGTWTPKELLGHLVDSACNNHQKFVRTAKEEEVNFVGYDQDFWVAIQQYNSYNWLELIDFWCAYNKHIAHLISHMSPEKLNNEIKIDGVGPFTLRFIMEDYTEHQIHHLKVILPEASLTSNFKNIYK